jgi:hypothetical protein
MPVRAPTAALQPEGQRDLLWLLLRCPLLLVTAQQQQWRLQPALPWQLCSQLPALICYAVQCKPLALLQCWLRLCRKLLQQLQLLGGAALLQLLLLLLLLLQTPRACLLSQSFLHPAPSCCLHLSLHLSLSLRLRPASSSWPLLQRSCIWVRSSASLRAGCCRSPLAPSLLAGLPPPEGPGLLPCCSCAPLAPLLPQLLQLLQRQQPRPAACRGGQRVALALEQQQPPPQQALAHLEAEAEAALPPSPQQRASLAWAGPLWRSMTLGGCWALGALRTCGSQL